MARIKTQENQREWLWDQIIPYGSITLLSSVKTGDVDRAIQEIARRIDSQKRKCKWIDGACQSVKYGAEVIDLYGVKTLDLSGISEFLQTYQGIRVLLLPGASLLHEDRNLMFGLWSLTYRLNIATVMPGTRSQKVNDGYVYSVNTIISNGQQKQLWERLTDQPHSRTRRILEIQQSRCVGLS